MIQPSSKSVLWTIATLMIAMLPQLGRMPWIVILIAIAPLAWRVLAELSDWPLPSAPVRHLGTALALATLFFSFGTLAGRRAAVSLLAVMLALKLLEAWRVRDMRLIVSFSLFLCVTQFLFTQNILMPVYALATIIAAMVALTHLQRNEAFGTDNLTPRMDASVFSELGFSVKLLTLALPVGLALFLLFPRWGSPLWGMPESTLDSRSGLSDSMEPGSIESLFMDDSPAFRVEFDSDPPPQRMLYWRGPVFWNFDGRTWSGSYFSQNLQAATLPRAADAEWSYRVQIEPNERHWLFSLDYPVDVPPGARITVDYQVISRKPITQLTEYAIRSNPEFIDQADMPETLKRAALDLPDDHNPRTRDLVRQWRRAGYEGETMVKRMLEYFGDEPFQYSLDAPLLARDSVDDFLFGTRTGFCEHYASAFAVAMRMAGIPSRIVTGYMGGWYNSVGDYVLVRQSDAHAWVEVWLPGTGWQRVDPTAAVSPSRVARGSLEALGGPRHLLDFQWLRRFRNTVDIVQQRWNDRVIEFGARRQSQLFSPLGVERVTPLGLIIALIIVIGVLSLVLLPVVSRMRGPDRRDPLTATWQLFLKRLEKAGFRSAPSSGAIELARAASEHLPDARPTITSIAELYTRSRYSARPPDLRVLRNAVRKFNPQRARA